MCNFLFFHSISEKAYVPFCLPKKEPKMHQGAAFDEHLAYAGVHRRPSPGPPNYGRRLPGSWAISSGRQNQDGLFFLPRALGPLCAKFGGSCAEMTPPTPAEPGRLGYLQAAFLKPIQKTKPGGSDVGCHSHLVVSVRAQKQSKALHKVLYQAFFQESGAYFS